MTFKLTFLKPALKDWDKLPEPIKKQLKAKLQERLESPIVLKDKLSRMPDCYKIKLRASGYRLVYRVFQERVTVQVISTGKRDKSLMYELAMRRVEALTSNPSHDPSHGHVVVPGTRKAANTTEPK